LGCSAQLVDFVDLNLINMAEEREIDQESEEDLAAQIASIVDRQCSGSFPDVLPSEQCALEECDASEILTWVQKEDAVRVQSYLAECYSAYRSAAINVVESEESLFRAQWARDHYYVHLREFVASQSQRHSVLEALKVALVWADLGDDRQKRVETAAKAVQPSQMTACMQFIDSQWEDVWGKLPRCVQVAPEAQKKTWLQENCEGVLQHFLDDAAKPTTTFEPELRPEEIIDSEAQETARKLLSLVKAEHVGAIQEAFQSEYEQATESVSASLLIGFEQDVRHNFLLERYYSIVDRIVNSTTVSSEFSYQPAVAVSELASVEAQEHARTLIARVQAHHAEQIDRLVGSRYASFEASLTSGCLKGFEAEIQQNWMREHFYETVEEVLGAGQAGIAQKDGVSRAASTAGGQILPLGQMFSSPRKRARRDPVANYDVEVTFNCVKDLHCTETGGVDALALQAVVLHLPEQVRWVTVTNRRTKEVENVAVISVLLADRTGPIVLDLWRRLAEDTLRDCEAWSSTNTEQLLMEVRYFWVRSDSKLCVPQTRKLASNDRTVVSIGDVARQSNLLSTQIEPSTELFTRDFFKLENRPPFQVNIAGCVTCLLPEVTSQSGNAMRVFRLNDSTGRWVLCTAFGRHVDNPVLVEGHEIVIYFGTAQQGLNNTPGQIWLYDEAHVVMLRSGCRTPPARTQMQLRGVA
jgi:hypothetical protein